MSEKGHGGNTLALGQRVVMTAGPFVGLMGTVVEINADSRLTLMAEFNNRAVPIEIDTAWLAPKARGSLRAGSVNAQAKNS